MASEAHGNGSIESVTLCRGNLLVVINDETKLISAGETIRYKTDTLHILKNNDKTVAQGFMINLL